MSYARRRASARGRRSFTSRAALGSLGDAAPDAPLTEDAWRGRMLQSQQTMVEWQKRWVERDELQRWLQLGATVALPLIAAAWRLIGVRRGWSI